jgi:hypothetical protein
LNHNQIWSFLWLSAHEISVLYTRYIHRKARERKLKSFSRGIILSKIIRPWPYSNLTCVFKWHIWVCYFNLLYKLESGDWKFLFFLRGITLSKMIGLKPNSSLTCAFLWCNIYITKFCAFLWCIHVSNLSWMCATVAEIMSRNSNMMEQGNTMCPQPFYGRGIKIYLLHIPKLFSKLSAWFTVNVFKFTCANFHGLSYCNLSRWF